jgi:hypothetical protein
MTIEPTNAFTVFIRAGKRSDEGRTLQDYLANIAARFPECVTRSGEPNLEALARRENAAMRKVTGHQHGRVGATTASVGATPRILALRQAFDRRKADRDAAILAFLDDFRTSGEVATRFGFSKETAQEAMRAMKEAGLIIMQRTGRTSVWRRATQEVQQ